MSAATIVKEPTVVDADPALTQNYLGSYDFQNPDSTQNFSPDMPLPPPEEIQQPPAQEKLPIPDAGAKPDASTAPPPAEQKKSRPEAQMRIEQREREREIAKKAERADELERRITELEAEKAARIAELETTATTYKTTADSYAKDLESIKSSWKNEREKEWTDIANELPEYREAVGKAESAWAGLFPRNIANPAAGEAEIRFNPANMSAENTQAVNRMVAQWAEWEYNDKVSDARRADAQHILVSGIAQRLGVAEEHMDRKELDGTAYNVIRPDHPVYGHLIGKIPDLVESRIQAAQLQQRAQSESKSMASEAIRKRQENRRESFKAAGFGLSGEELKSRAVREPSNPVIQALNLLGDNEELRSELQGHLEQEAITDGFWKPNFTIPEEDPKAYDQAARAHMGRIASRPVMASIGQVLLKQTAQLKAERDELAAKVKELQEEQDRAVRQSEPGAGAGGSVGHQDREIFQSQSPYLSGYSFRG